MKFYGLSKIGLIRETNEDEIFIDQNRQLFIVADGMGGHVAGEIASKIAVKSILEFLSENNKKITLTLLKEAILYANKSVLDYVNKNKKLKGMGTTVTLGIIIDNKLLWGHIGDSKIFLLRDEKLLKITTDHSIVGDLLLKGKVSKTEALKHPERNLLTRAVGIDKNLEVDVDSFTIKEKDRILFCTDGLNINEEKIKLIISDFELDEEKIVNKLIEETYKIGATDNITVILITM